MRIFKWWVFRLVALKSAKCRVKYERKTILYLKQNVFLPKNLINNETT